MINNFCFFGRLFSILKNNIQNKFDFALDIYFKIFLFVYYLKNKYYI